MRRLLIGVMVLIVGLGTLIGIGRALVEWVPQGPGPVLTLGLLVAGLALVLVLAAAGPEKSRSVAFRTLAVLVVIAGAAVVAVESFRSAWATITGGRETGPQPPAGLAPPAQSGPFLGLVLGLVVVVVLVLVWWCFSVPRRATVVLTKLVVADKEGAERPHLRRLWWRGPVWRLAWRMPIGGTVARVQANRAALEEALDCGARVWFNRGLLWAELGVERLPDQVDYQRFTRKPRKEVAGMVLPVPVGVSRRGPLWTDLTRLPHVLVGGTTNFGKSGFLRQLLAWLVTWAGPQSLALVLVDLKSGVEFNVFGALPHLWHSLMTDLAQCEEGLSRVSAEIDRRLALLRATHVENIARYREAEPGESLPYLVVVVDEVGELRPGDTTDKEERAARQRVAGLLIRIGRLGRAAGVHLVCATQRPDADTVGGQLKAQLPATLAFFCRDDVNSRILLDNAAASELPAQPGRAIWQHGADQVQVQVPFLELVEAEEMVAVVVDARRAAEAEAQVAALPSPSGDAA